MDPPATGAVTVILDEQRMAQTDNVGFNRYNLSLSFSVDRHIVQGSLVSFVTDINNLDTPLSLAALGVSSGGHFSGYLIAE